MYFKIKPHQYPIILILNNNKKSLFFYLSNESRFVSILIPTLGCACMSVALCDAMDYSLSKFFLSWEPLGSIPLATFKDTT